MMQISQPHAARRPSTGRRGRMLALSVPMLGWLVAALVVVVMHRFIPEPRWMMVHVLTLGVATNAIVVWSSYFTDAVLRGHRASHTREVLVLAVLNTGIALVVLGMWRTDAWAVVLGALAVAAAVIGHGVALLLQARTALPSAFGVTVRFYATAALMLPLGVGLGVLMARVPYAPILGMDAELAADGTPIQLLLAHLAFNLLGWVGLTVWGTLITLFPTMLRTRAADGAAASGKRAWGVMTLAIVVLAAAALLGWQWLAAAALLAYLWGIGLVAAPMVAAALAKPPRSFATWSVIAGAAWFIGTLVAAAVILAISPDMATALPGIRALAIPFIAFLAQVLAGALAYLVPVIIGGGPSVVRSTTAITERGAVLRVGLANLAGVLYVLPVPSTVAVTTSLAAFVALAATPVLLVMAVVRGLGMVRAARGAAAGRGSGTRPVQEDAEPAVRRRRTQGQLAGAAAVLALVVAMAGAIDPIAVLGADPRATHAAQLDGAQGAADQTAAGQAAADQAAAGQDSAAAAATTTVAVTAAGMEFTPSVVEVPAGNRLVLEVTNADTTGQVHDLVLATGLDTGRLVPGQTVSLDAGIITSDVEAWCSVAGHRQMGMTLDIVAVGASEDPHADHGADAAAPSGADAPASSGADDAVLDPQASPADGFEAYDAVLPPAPEATVHRHTFTVGETRAEVAPGVTQELWTFNGTAPGPVLRGKVGDVFEITLVNDGSLGHGIDFHAGALAPDEPMRVIAPGEELVYRFTATRAGIWMYHCSAVPMSTHISNGMFGTVIIDPPDLPEVDKEYVLVQSEQYYGPQGEAGNADKVQARTPDAVVFNGYPNQYDHQPLTATTGERVRIWVLNAGPNEDLAFHIVGGQFDSFWKEGDWRLKCGESVADTSPANDERCTEMGPGGSQTLDLMASQGGFVELEAPEAGHYAMVNHQMVLAERGAHGILEVTD